MILIFPHVQILHKQYPSERRGNIWESSEAWDGVEYTEHTVFHFIERVCECWRLHSGFRRVTAYFWRHFWSRAFSFVELSNCWPADYILIIRFEWCFSEECVWNDRREKVSNREHELNRLIYLCYQCTLRWAIYRYVYVYIFFLPVFIYCPLTGIRFATPKRESPYLLSYDSDPCDLRVT